MESPKSPDWHPLQMSSQGTRPLHGEPWDYPGPHLLKLQPSHQDNEYIPIIIRNHLFARKRKPFKLVQIQMEQLEEYSGISQNPNVENIMGPPKN